MDYTSIISKLFQNKRDKNLFKNSTVQSQKNKTNIISWKFEINAENLFKSFWKDNCFVKK